jgi:glycerate 2-kinase
MPPHESSSTLAQKLTGILKMVEWDDARARQLLRSLFDATVAQADPGKAVCAHLPAKPVGKCVVVGAGKASAAMASAVDAAWPDVDLGGVVVTRYGHAMPAGRIKIVQASHPLPDANSLLAAKEILAAVKGLTKEDLVLALMSGGGSALLCMPPAGLSLSDKIVLNEALLRSGATISEMNAVRSWFSEVKGGRLAAAAAPAQVVTLVISDVPSDDPAVVASGPTIPHSMSGCDVREILNRHCITLPSAAQPLLDRPRSCDLPPTSGDVRMIGTPRLALDAAAKVAHAHDLASVILGDAIEGESKHVATVMSGIAHSVRTMAAPAKPPVLLLSGGETTVTLEAGISGRGGRNTEFLLSLAIGLKGLDRVWAFAGDTDGIDGNEDAAGAIIAPDTLIRGRKAGLDAARCLAAHDSYTFFNTINDLVRTGPTFTNVNDFRAILIA